MNIADSQNYGDMNLYHDKNIILSDFMEVVYDYDDDRKIIIIRVSGEMTIETITPISIENRLKAKKMNYKLLYDFRRSSYKKAIVDAYKFFEENFDDIEIDSNYIPTANIINEEDVEFFKFIETTMTNRGARLRYFTDEEKGVEWLLSLR